MEKEKEISGILYTSETISICIRFIIEYMLLISFFLTGNGIETEYFTFYWYYPVYILLLVSWFVRYHTFHYGIVVLIGIVFLHTGVKYFLSGPEGLGMISVQLVNIIFSLLLFYYYLKYEDFDLIEIFRKYIVVAKIVAVIGFIQVLLFLVGLGDVFVSIFFFKTNISYRLQSVTLEPSFIAYTFAPIVFLAFYNLFNRRTYLISSLWSILFIVAYFLTFSSIAYISILMCLIVLFFNRLSLYKVMLSGFVFALIALLAFGMYRLLPEVKMRLDDTVYGFSADITNPKVYRKVNLSTYAWLSNAYVTRNAMKENPIFGSGLGTYRAVYDKFIPDDMKKYWPLNRTDANSMALRLLAETGWVGFGLICFFIIRFKAPYRAFYGTEEKILWIINNGICVLLLLSLIRNGNYTIMGKMLFILMYFFIWKVLRGRWKLHRESQVS